MLIPLLFQVLVISCWTYALVYGGKIARWAFIPFLFMSMGTKVATALGQSYSHPTLERWQGVNWELLFSDSIYLIGITIIAFRCRRYWPIWAAGLQLVCVLSNLGPLLVPDSNPKIYRALESIWALPMLATMVIGISKDRRADRNGDPTGISSGRGKRAAKV